MGEDCAKLEGRVRTVSPGEDHACHIQGVAGKSVWLELGEE